MDALRDLLLPIVKEQGCDCRCWRENRTDNKGLRKSGKKGQCDGFVVPTPPPMIKSQRPRAAKFEALIYPSMHSHLVLDCCLHDLGGTLGRQWLVTRPSSTAGDAHARLVMTRDLLRS